MAPSENFVSLIIQAEVVLIKMGCTDKEIEEAILNIIRSKPENHSIDLDENYNLIMSRIGE